MELSRQPEPEDAPVIDLDVVKGHLEHPAPGALLGDQQVDPAVCSQGDGGDGADPGTRDVEQDAVPELVQPQEAPAEPGLDVHALMLPA